MPVSDTLRRVQGGSDIPIPLFDDFNRPNSTNLGVTSVGGRPWIQGVGTWDIVSNRIRNLSGSNPVAVVDGYTPNVELQIDVSSTGRDALVFRYSDPSNWLRLSNYYTQSTSNTFTMSRVCANPINPTGSCPCSQTGCGSCPGCPGPTCHSVCTHNGSCTSTGSVCSSSTTTTRRVYLHRMQNGSLSQIALFSVGVTSRLRVIANGNTIQCYSGSGTTLVNTRTEAFNNDATFHGVGRSTLGNAGSSMDNFNLIPLAA